LKILHTSDWHIGKSLYGKQRYEEFESFFKWLLKLIDLEGIDVLLISGDIFDTTTPGNRAQEIYYSFLSKISRSRCIQTIIIAGNHDSPSFLSAPKGILKDLNISIVTDIDNMDDLIIPVRNGEEEVKVVAIPYLRDKDLRVVEDGESLADKNLKVVTGIKDKFHEICDYGKSKNISDSPMILMGHLFVAGCSTGDGERELYVGTLAQVGSDIIPSYIRYAALGHLHVPQEINKSNHIRYSGSPIPMGFDESIQKKEVVIIDLKKSEIDISRITVPCFQKLSRITGDKPDILNQLDLIKKEGINTWVEIEYSGSQPPGTLQEEIEDRIKESNIEVRVIKNRYLTQLVLDENFVSRDLTELSYFDVFEKCLESADLQDDEELKTLYRDVVKKVEEADINL